MTQEIIKFNDGEDFIFQSISDYVEIGTENGRYILDLQDINLLIQFLQRHLLKVENENKINNGTFI